MRRHVMLSGLVATVAVCLVGVSGCDSGDPKPENTSTSSSPAGAPETTSADSTADALPDGYQYVTAPESGIQIAVPDDWSAVDAERVLSDPAMQSLLDDMASRRGVSADQLMGTGVDLVAMSAQGTPNANVLEPQPGTLSPGFAADVTTQLETLFSATDITTREVTTAVGDAIVASYTASMGGARFYQNQIYQEVGSSVVVITVTGTDASQAAELTGTILDTMQSVD